LKFSRCKPASCFQKQLEVEAATGSSPRRQPLPRQNSFADTPEIPANSLTVLRIKPNAAKLK
jgi:hypothetical protein